MLDKENNLKKDKETASEIDFEETPEKDTSENDMSVDGNSEAEDYQSLYANEINEATEADIIPETIGNITPKSPEIIAEEKAAKTKSGISSVLDYVEIFVFAITFVIVLFSFFARICTVVGPSMENTLYQGEALIVYDFAYEPERGDIVVFHQTGTLNEPIVKRVIATGGETVDIDFDTWTVTITDTDGNTFVLDEPYMYLDKSSPLTTSVHKYPYKVPEGKLFVMGDNRNHSSDSRGYDVGLVDERRILGKVIIRVFPFDKFGKVE